MKIQLTILTISFVLCFLSASSNTALTPAFAHGVKGQSLSQQLSTLPETGLTVFQNRDQKAPSTDLRVGLIYEGSGATGSGFMPLPAGFDNRIKSFNLPKGYLVTFAENIDGTGESITYVAATSALSQNLPGRLVNKVSFVRYVPISNITKKGIDYIDTNVVSALNCDWYYNWGNLLKYTKHQFVPMTWGKKTSSVVTANYFIGLAGVDHILTFNEPDNISQSNIPVDTALNQYKMMLRTGLRLGSPAVKQENAFGDDRWLTLFMAGAAEQKVRVDFIPLHWYDWGNPNQILSTDSLTAAAVLTRFKNYVTTAHRNYPSQMIWITEFNANPRRTNSNIHEIFMRNAAAWLDAQPYVERYAYFFPNVLPPTTGAPNYKLTPIGRAWKNIVSTPAFAANIIPN